MATVTFQVFETAILFSISRDRIDCLVSTHGILPPLSAEANESSSLLIGSLSSKLPYSAWDGTIRIIKLQ
jgi:hypothetical protein